MDLDFHVQFSQQLGTFFNPTLGGLAQLGQDAFYAFMVGFQQVNGVHGQTSCLSRGQAQTVFLPLSLTLLEHFSCLFHGLPKNHKKQWDVIE
jgi:hypothetical protein